MPPPTTIDLVALANGSFKRLAWAYGCSPRGSAEEAVLERMLRDRVMTESAPPDDEAFTDEELDDWASRLGPAARPDMMIGALIAEVRRYRMARKREPKAEAIDLSTAPR